MIDNCPVCGALTGERFLCRLGVPVHQNLLFASQVDAINVVRGDLEMAACSSCGFVYNASFDPTLLSYGEYYDNSQHCSPFFSSYMDELVRELVEKQGVRNCRVIEVGCGKGVFLRRLIDYPSAGNIGVGFDPSYEGPESVLDGRLTFRRQYYGRVAEQERADVVICRHVIEHIQSPVSLLKSVRFALRGSPNARVFFETPCSEWILRNEVIWDLFYEHCSLFTPESLTSAFELAGFAVHRVERRFNNQYLWIEAIPLDEPRQPVFCAGDVPLWAEDFGRHETHLKKSWLERVLLYRQRGEVAVWGAGAKGCTFVNLLDPQRTLISCIVDVNPAKHEKYVAGSGHPIVSPYAVASRGVQSAILMNPNYREEIESQLSAASIRVDLVE
jgi:SAM-dependent methyltransferase